MSNVLLFYTWSGAPLGDLFCALSDAQLLRTKKIHFGWHYVLCSGSEMRKLIILVCLLSLQYLHKACWTRHYILMCMNILCRQCSLLTVSVFPCLLWMIICDKQTVRLCMTLGYICISLTESHSGQGSALQDIHVTIVMELVIIHKHWAATCAWFKIFCLWERHL